MTGMGKGRQYTAPSTTNSSEFTQSAHWVDPPLDLEASTRSKETESVDEQVIAAGRGILGQRFRSKGGGVARLTGPPTERELASFSSGSSSSKGRERAS